MSEADPELATPVCCLISLLLFQERKISALYRRHKTTFFILMMGITTFIVGLNLFRNFDNSLCNNHAYATYYTEHFDH